MKNGGSQFYLGKKERLRECERMESSMLSNEKSNGTKIGNGPKRHASYEMNLVNFSHLNCVFRRT